MRILTALLAAVFAFAPAVFAQNDVAPKPESAGQSNREPGSSFEVASVRIDPPNSAENVEIHNTGAVFIASHVNLRLLIGLAYGIDHIVGGPKWIESQTYSVNAKVEGDRLLSAKEMQPLERQLLEDRFHLVVHRETRQVQGYGLLVAKSGPKLQPVKGDSQTGYMLRDTLRFSSTSLDTFAAVVAHVIGRPVADRTGIKGSYNITLHYAPADSSDSRYPSIFTALQEQLGLKLESQQVPDEILVIDSVDREPTEN